MQSQNDSNSAPASRVNILGVGVSGVNMAEALDRIAAAIADKRKGYICVTGVHGIMESQSDDALRTIHNRSFLTVPDGMPTVWLGRLQGLKAMRRVYGPDLMLALCQLSVEKGYRHFLYGGNDGVAERLKETLENRFPGLQITGTYTPPFRALNEDEERDLQTQVSEARPDIVWVGLSTPKQERFMSAYISRLNTSIMLGVGAAFDVHTSGVADAPSWMQRAGLHWLFRLFQEPRRLWRRYLVNNPIFLAKTFCQLAKITKYNL